jgi:S1-C subfamily serine protease
LLVLPVCFYTGGHARAASGEALLAPLSKGRVSEVYGAERVPWTHCAQVLAALGQEGVLVLEVPPGSPGIAAGLKHTHRDIFGCVILGDVIVGLDGK